MHSSRMRTTGSLTVSLYLAISHAPPLEQPHMSPPEQPRMPPRSNHTPPRATMHTPLGATMHAPPEQPCTPPQDQPCMPPPGATMHPHSVNRMTNMCKNITLPQTSFAGGKKLLREDRTWNLWGSTFMVS